jgi:hypothetical protein
MQSANEAGNQAQAQPSKPKSHRLLSKFLRRSKLRRVKVANDPDRRIEPVARAAL